jgi:soluble lytic murein transglycosylase
MLKTKKILSTFALISTSLSILASLPTAYASTSERALYKQAKAALIKNDTVLADKLIVQLRDYPLVPYLHIKQFKRDISQLNDNIVSKYIQDNKATPFADDAQRIRLDNMMEQQRWQSFTRAYNEFPLKNNRYICGLSYAQLQAGHKKEAFKAAQQLWEVGHSQDAACDPLFAEWIKEGHLTSDVASHRFWNAIQEKNFALAKYIERFLSDPIHKKESELFWSIKAKPALLNDVALLSKQNPHHGIIAAYGIRQIARKDISQATDLWLRDRTRLTIDQPTLDKLNEYFGLRYAKGFRDNAVEILAKLDPEFTYEKLTEWRIRLELAKQDWQSALNLIEKLPDTLKADGRWAYWKETAKYRLNPKNYQANYASIVKERSFYGFLASELSSDPFYLNHQPSGVTTEQKATLSKLPAVIRMKELLVFDYQYAARVEWNFLNKQLSASDQLAMAHIAYDWGWYDQAIRGASRLKAWNDLDIRFPNPHPSLFAELASERGIYQTWAIAIARQESAFHLQARSRVGARGLMQLMPATAKQTAKRFDVNYTKPDQLFIPRTNIALGTAYLAQVLVTFEGNRAYATAAYNAGPHRVKRWLKERGDVPLDVWIETIPFDETRNYVQNVLAFSVIYDVMASRSTTLFNEQESASFALNFGNKLARPSTL